MFGSTAKVSNNAVSEESFYYFCRIKTLIMTTLYLVRHGETEDNVAQIMQGQTQGRLTERGRQQAMMLAGQLAGRHFDAFVSSDLRRAVDTAAIVAGPHAMTVETTPLLRERDWGGFTGRHIPELQGVPWPDDIETLEQLMERASTFIDYVKSRHSGQCVLAVGHGIINKAVQAVYHGLPMNRIARMDNAEVRILELE